MLPSRLPDFQEWLSFSALRPADKTAKHLDAWLDAQAQLRAYPPMAISLAAKKVRGEELTPAEQCCLSRYRRRGPPQLAPNTGLHRFADLIAQTDGGARAGQLP